MWFLVKWDWSFEQPFNITTNKWSILRSRGLLPYNQDLIYNVPVLYKLLLLQHLDSMLISQILIIPFTVNIIYFLKARSNIDHDFTKCNTNTLKDDLCHDNIYTCKLSMSPLFSFLTPTQVNIVLSIQAFSQRK